MIKTVIKLFSTDYRRVFLRGLRDLSGGWGGKGRIGEVWNLGTFSQLAIKRMLVSDIFLRLTKDLRCCSWCFEQIFEDGESFLLQRKCATVNYFEFRHHPLIEEFTSDNSELVNQDARIVWASLISPLEVARYDCLPHPDVSTSSVPRKNWNKTLFQLVFEPVIFVKCNFLGIIVSWLSSGWKYTVSFLNFSVIWFGNLCCKYL